MNDLPVKNDISALMENRARSKMFTTIEDMKTIYNLDNNVDFKINDCKGEIIEVKDVLLKIIDIPEKFDNENKKISEREIKKISIIISKQNKSYVTASKVFANQLLNFIDTFGIEKIKGGFTIKIIERTIKNSKNKALGFELLD